MSSKSKYPSWVRSRANEIFMSFGSLKGTALYPPKPELQILKKLDTPNICLCGCGQSVRGRGSGSRRYKQGHWAQKKWDMAHEQAEREYEQWIIEQKKISGR